MRFFRLPGAGRDVPSNGAAQGLNFVWEVIGFDLGPQHLDRLSLDRSQYLCQALVVDARLTKQRRFQLTVIAQHAREIYD